MISFTKMKSGKEDYWRREEQLILGVFNVYCRGDEYFPLVTSLLESTQLTPTSNTLDPLARIRRGVGERGEKE